MKKFVLDEWLMSDLQGENGEEAQRDSLSVLLEVFHRCDQLIAVENSPFLLKFYTLAKEASTGDPRRSVVKFFKEAFLLNAEKLVRLWEHDLKDLPADLKSRIKKDDEYLVRAYFTANADLLVTTDNPLIEISKAHGINCKGRKEFIRDYLGSIAE